ncbi:MAG: pyridoxal phosphate-dependent aminotransferase [Spirochaetia bacterium]|nr:pyridoxal phosphate-dependent aminotransferase [Spirochaetia bacterium]
MSTRFYASRLGVVEPSPTLAVTARAKELRAAGKDIIGFGAGEPDFDTPDHIKRAAIKAIEEGQTKYTGVGGTPALKKAIIEKFRRENSLEYTPSQVTASTGGKQVLYNLFQAVINPGDEVVIPAPYWVSYADMVRLAEGTPVIVYCPVAQNYLITADQLRKAITPRTKAVIINSPSNPTGATFTKEQLLEIGRVLLEFPDLLIVSDDIYEHIIYDGLRFFNLPLLMPELKSRTFVVNGVSKAYSMTGWRIGFGAGDAQIIENMETIQGQSTSNPCSIAQAAAVAALLESQDCVEQMRRAFEQRRGLVHRMFQAIPGTKTNMPQGAFYIFPDLTDIYQTPKFQALKKKGTEESDSKVLCAHLLDHYEVAAVPGIAFGDDRGLRISYALDETSLRKGLERFGNMVNDLM